MAEFPGFSLICPWLTNLLTPERDSRAAPFVRRGLLIGPTKTACAPGYDRFAIRRCHRWPKVGPPMGPENDILIKSLNYHDYLMLNGGDGGIRTLDRALQPYNGLANRRLQPLGHISAQRHRLPLSDICPRVPAIARAARGALCRRLWRRVSPCLEPPSARALAEQDFARLLVVGEIRIAPPGNV